MNDDRNWELTCAEFLELTTEYLEEALQPADKTRFESHLAICEGCTAVLGQLKTQIELTGQLDEHDVEPEQLNRLLDAFSDWKDD